MLLQGAEAAAATGNSSLQQHPLQQLDSDSDFATPLLVFVCFVFLVSFFMPHKKIQFKNYCCTCVGRLLHGGNMCLQLRLRLRLCLLPAPKTC